MRTPNEWQRNLYVGDVSTVMDLAALETVIKSIQRDAWAAGVRAGVATERNSVEACEWIPPLFPGDTEPLPSLTDGERDF